jgi:UDP-glucose 4-epimerase
VFDTRESPYGARTIVGDVTDLGAVASAARGCDAIVHLAAIADVNEVKDAPVATESVNARGTLAVLEAARAERCRVVYASTIWVYGDRAVDEDGPLAAPAHIYTATKLAGELYCRSYRELYGVEYTILRFGIPYGPRAREAAVLPAFVIRAYAGEPLTIAGTGEQSRRFVYVEDLAEGVVAALAPVAADRIYNLVGDETVTIREIAELVQRLVRPVDIVHAEGRKGDFAGVEVSGERAARELGWRATTGFDEGARRYVDWYVSTITSAADGSFAKSA